MKPITLSGIDEYAERHSTPDPDSLLSLVAETRHRFADPQMMIGPLEARFLQMLLFALRPRRVLEIGTFTGYSALSLAAALPPDGQLVTCEADECHAEVAARHIQASCFAERIRIEVGPALKTLARLEGPFDFIFIDADKQNYLSYFEAVLPKLAPGGLIAADNTLWDGTVLDDTVEEADAVAVRRFNDTVAVDSRVVCALVTVRDGVTLIRRA
jgi:caffeoyl-CoA O-methyltransferase